MTFADTNVFMYAVGGPHPLQRIAWEFLRLSYSNGSSLCTSAEVLQELAHAYLRVGRTDTFDRAMTIIRRYGVTVLPLEAADVLLARQLYERYPHLSARDLCHLATCQRRGITELMTFDGNLAAAFSE
ncbi:MAG: type II toxin-antitoxin system VapC family toxin [Chloroflexi bacterium]|nr:type II toxin-antitoxin system VapC family toxin [Chloroflexota bacterium]